MRKTKTKNVIEKKNDNRKRLNIIKQLLPSSIRKTLAGVFKM